MLTSRDSDEQIKVAADPSNGPEPAALFSKELTGLFVDPDQRNAFQKVVQYLLALVRVSGVIHAFIKFSK